jgi:ABC-type glucose/galactose transport system permease subunit
VTVNEYSDNVLSTHLLDVNLAFYLPSNLPFIDNTFYDKLNDLITPTVDTQLLVYKLNNLFYDKLNDLITPTIDTQLLVYKLNNLFYDKLIFFDNIHS